MNYRAKVTADGPVKVVEFPDCPGCVTQVEKGEDLTATAREALEGWLEAVLQNRELPPKPKYAGRGVDIEVEAVLSLKLDLLWARKALGLTQSELARRAGVSQPMIAKLEHPDYNPGWRLVAKVLRALGAHIEIKRSKQKHNAA